MIHSSLNTSELAPCCEDAPCACVSGAHTSRLRRVAFGEVLNAGLGNRLDKHQNWKRLNQIVVGVPCFQMSFLAKK